MENKDNISRATLYSAVETFINNLKSSEHITFYEQLDYDRNIVSFKAHAIDGSITKYTDFIRSIKGLENSTASFEIPCIEISKPSFDRYLIVFSDKINFNGNFGSATRNFSGYVEADKKSFAATTLLAFKSGDVLVEKRTNAKCKYPATLETLYRAINGVASHKHVKFFTSVWKAFLTCSNTSLFKDLLADFNRFGEENFVKPYMSNSKIKIKDLFDEKNSIGKSKLYENVYGSHHRKYLNVCPPCVAEGINLVSDFFKKSGQMEYLDSFILKIGSYEDNKPLKIYTLLCDDLFVNRVLCGNNRVSSFEKVSKKGRLIDILLCYIRISTSSENFGNRLMEVQDYCSYCVEFKEKISLNKRSINGILREHYKQIERSYLSPNKKLSGKSLIASKSIYHKLPTLKDMSLLSTDEDLYAEGVIQHNCVFSYKDKVKRGECAIFSMIRKDYRYTIEMRNIDDKFQLAQVRGKYNALPPKEISDELNSWIEYYNANSFYN